MRDKIKILRAAFPEAMQSVRKRAVRSAVRFRLDIARASRAERFHAERMLRGRERYGHLERADAVVVSYPKSGRTWLRVMVSRLYQQIYDLPENTLIGFDNFHYMNRRIPRLLFTHDDYIRDFTGHTDSKRDFYDKKVLLLARDPRDVAVSMFFHWSFRTQPWKKQLNHYPPHGTDCSIYDFVCGADTGIPRIIDFMNQWSRERDRIREFELLRYEDMRVRPVETLDRVARFLGIPAGAARIQEAVEYASYESMKKKEADQSFRMSGTRLAPGDSGNPESYKVRRAKVGGYRDYFDDDQIGVIDGIVSDTLDPFYGYASAPVPKVDTK
jgi:alcohol sulfotransferase